MSRRPSPRPAMAPAEPMVRAPHSPLEDAVALVIGTLVVSFGVHLIKQTGALTGGTAGLAFLIHYATGVRFGLAFFLINIPFYLLALRYMGRALVVKTVLAVGLVSVFAEVHPLFLQVAHVNPFYAALFGNAVMGLGFLVLFRHRASLGGTGILALFAQERYGVRAGHVQLGFDLLILLASFAVVSPPLLLASVGGAVVLNTIIAMNHRPDRYLA
ncbi:YitT family protein [Aquabacterium sp.]|uniref:YitT family protein n=1 Tax=Aquabacterium sp. TaxID=1872578 RepID=UPI0025C4300B|nr:YitT family protein [Aquabacterium sp.]